MILALTFVVVLLVGVGFGVWARTWIFSRFFRHASSDRLIALGARFSARKTMAEEAELLGYADLAQRMRELAAEDQQRIGEAVLKAPTSAATEEEDS